MDQTIPPKTLNSSTYEYEKIDRKGNPWRPGFFRHAPWLGLAALLGALMGTLAAVIVLYISDNKPVHDWTVQPPVYLAIASTATNILLHFALTKAVVIAWWRRALRKDTTIAGLHRYWEDGQSFWAALTSGRRFSVVSLASIFVALVPINNPLLQRASRIHRGHFERNADVHVNIAREIPEGYTGYLSNRGHSPTLLTPPFVKVVQDFNQRTPIPIPPSGCTGECKTKIVGAGLAANCSKSESPFYMGGEQAGITDNEATQQMINGTDVFGTYLLWPSYAADTSIMGEMLDWPVMTLGTFNLGVQYKGTADCSGKLAVRNCTFRPATVAYPVTMGNGNISLTAGTTIDDDEVLDIVALPPIWETETESSFNISTYGGFFKSLSDLYDSSLLMNFGGIGWQIINHGTLSNRYLNLSTSLESLSCNMSFLDPADDVIAAIRELMFRTAIASANVTKAANVQNVTAQESFYTTVYTSSYRFLALAVAFTFFGWMATLSAFLGWWHLGRTVSLSPIETAKAFGTPSLNTQDSNADVKGILKDVGEREVRYGAMTLSRPDGAGDEAEEKTCLIIGEPEFVRHPSAGEIFVCQRRSEIVRD